MALLTAKELNATAPYADSEDLDALKELSRNLTQDSDVVMIGAGPGVMALAVMEDHRPLDAPYLHIIEIDNLAWVETHLDAADVSASRVEFVRGDSGEVGKDWQGEIDLLIIDGDHSAKGVGRDIDAWWDKVKVGGIVFFHDWLERPGGFNGVGAWVTGGVAAAVLERKRSGAIRFEEWNCPTDMLGSSPGISFVARKLA